jgi:serine/threonine protein kinase
MGALQSINEYTAPELYSDMKCHNHPPVTQKIDVYSFGVLLSKILCNNLPSSSPQDGIDPGWIYQLTEIAQDRLLTRVQQWMKFSCKLMEHFNMKTTIADVFSLCITIIIITIFHITRASNIFKNKVKIN